MKLDHFGGSPQLHCSNKTGHFIVTKLGNRWWFCTPDGNVFISMSVGNVLPNGARTLDCQNENTYPIYIAKYGDATFNWGWQTLKRMTAWGFNSVGQDSGPNVFPFRTCRDCLWPQGKQPIPLPYLTESRPVEYAAVNKFGYLAEPIKDEITGTNDHYDFWRGGGLFDVFDPKLDTEWQKELRNTNNVSIQNLRNNYPYLLGVLTDDSDWFTGSGASPDFASGKTTTNLAWITLITSPVRTFIQSPPYASNKGFLYEDTKNYSKSMATNPTTPCSIANPCSLRDYLWQEYGGNIANLNTAWRAHYTSFDSTGTDVNGEKIGAGDGVTKTFSHTLAHVTVSPYSVLLFVGGKAIAGDCPWFHNGCGLKRKNLGTIGSPEADLVAQAASTIDYSTGAITVAFDTPPVVGASITINYVSGGWMAGGTGLMDEDGSHSAWLGTNPWCLEGPNPNFSTYFACVGGGGQNEPVPNANPNLGADLDNWIPQFSARFFKTMHDDLKAVSKIPYFGLDILGAYGVPAYSKFLQGAAPYLDGAFVSLKSWAPAPSPAVFQSAYQYTTKYLGDIPMMTFTVITAQANSSYYCKPSPNPSNDMPNQAIRGQMWYNTVSYLQSKPSFNGDFQFVGHNWWSWQDFQGLNQGVVSLRDDAYDGQEDVTATVPCSAPLDAFRCGGEPANYGNAIEKIKQANVLWYSLLP